jgi:hypothetical protein
MAVRDRVRRLALSLVGLALLTATPVIAQPSRLIGPYVLFAQDSIHIRTANIQDGDVGVNAGVLYSTGNLVAGMSKFAADVTHLGPSTDCETLFTNSLVGGAAACPKASLTLPRPLLTSSSLSNACGFPPPSAAHTCDATMPRFVGHNQTLSLTPGQYGDLTVEGGGEGPATLKLAPGEYVFCNVRIGRAASVLFSGPATVFVNGTVRSNNAIDVAPDKSVASPPQPGEIKWFVGGSAVRFSRRGNIQQYLCAPNAKLNIGNNVALTGRFVAHAITLRNSHITFTLPVPGVCGDGVVSTDEQCDINSICPGGASCVDCQCVNPNSTTTTTISSSTTTTTLPCQDDADCNNGSPNGAFVCMDGHCVPRCQTDADCNNGSPNGAFVCVDGHCVPRCTDDADCSSAGGAFICVDGHCVPSGSTTTTTTTGTSSTSSTTSTPTTTTSTTLHPCTTDQDCPIGTCVEGMCVPQCTDNADCNVGSPSGALVCVDGRCQPNTAEICGDCLDNNGDGLIDFEDPQCCAQNTTERFDMVLRKGRLHPRKGSGASLVRLRGKLAEAALGSMIDPRSQQVEVQIRTQGPNGSEVLCARIPVGKFRKTHKGFRYSKKKSPLPTELGRNLDSIRIKVLKNGAVRFRVRGKKASLTTPPEGLLQLSIGFLRQPSADNVCSQAVRLFRGNKKGALSFP